MSPRSGTLSSTFCTSSRIRPPSTTVWPSHTLTLVVTLRVLKMGWLMTFGVRTLWGELINPPVTLLRKDDDGARIGLP